MAGKDTCKQSSCLKRHLQTKELSEKTPAKEIFAEVHRGKEEEPIKVPRKRAVLLGQKERRAALPGQKERRETGRLGQKVGAKKDPIIGFLCRRAGMLGQQRAQKRAS